MESSLEAIAHVFLPSPRSEKVAFTNSRRVIGEDVSYPLLGSGRVDWMAGDAIAVT